MMPITSLGGFVSVIWPLANPAMFAWALAAIIPLIIHVWYRRQAMHEPWAAMTFLAAALRKHSRRLNLERWLLLIIRVAILLVLALALANPLIPTSQLGSASPVAEPSHLILVVDASYSMQLVAELGQTNGQTVFDRAKDEALRQIDFLQSDDAVSLILLADKSGTRSLEPIVDRSTLRAEIDAWEPQPTTSSFQTLWTELQTLIEQVCKSHPRYRQHRICIISDLTRNLWGDLRQASLPPALTTLAKQATIEVIDLGRETANAAVTQLTAKDPLVIPGKEMTVEARVQLFGAQQPQRRMVEFWLNGNSLGRQPIEIPFAGQATVQTRIRIDTPGDHIISASLDADDLPLDDRRWHVVSVPPRIDVLVVEGRAEEGQYVALALNPDTNNPDSAVHVVTTGEAALTEHALAKYSLVVLTNIARFTRDEGDALRDYVRQGGTLVVFPGDLIQVDNYNSELSAEIEGVRLLPATIGAPIVTGDRRLDARQYEDPLIAPFRGQEQAGLLTTPIWTHVPLQVLENESAHGVLWFTDGSVALARQRLQQGQSILLATAASPQSLNRGATPPLPWTAWPTWPSFLPLLQQCLREAVAIRQTQRNQLVGTPWLISQPDQRPMTELQVELPSADGSPSADHPHRILVDQQTHSALFDDTTRPGVYRAREAGRDDFSPLLAVNLDIRESDLERIDRALLPDCFSDTNGNTGATKLPDRQTAETRSPHSLFRQCLALLLGLILTESSLAWWFGRARR